MSVAVAAAKGERQRLVVADEPTCRSVHRSFRQIKRDAAQAASWQSLMGGLGGRRFLFVWGRERSSRANTLVMISVLTSLWGAWILIPVWTIKIQRSTPCQGVAASVAPDLWSVHPNLGPLFSVSDWCERGDSNPHPLRDQILSLARLPIPPLSHGTHYIVQEIAAHEQGSCTADSPDPIHLRIDSAGGVP